MKIELINLKLENFKRLKSYEIKPDGENIIIKGQNKAGKTTVFDAWLWLLFGKNSEGKTDSGKSKFEVGRLDGNNQPIKGLVVAVEAKLDFDGTVHVFRKERHEKVVRHQLRGYETLCWIDEVPKGVNDYSDYIADLIPEDVFKLLTDLYHFNSKMSWAERRAILPDIAGEIGTPKGFDALLGDLNGREVDEYKKVLAEQKKRHEKERSEINPRIDEIQRNLDEYAGTDTAELEKQRDAIKAEIKHLDEDRQKVADQETSRQKKLERLSSLKADRIEREAFLKNDPSGIKHLLNEKMEIESEVGGKRLAARMAQNALDTKQVDLKSKAVEFDQLSASLETVRTEYGQVEKLPSETVCYACKQPLLAGKVEEMKKSRQAKLAAITQRGDKIYTQVKKVKNAIAALEDECKDLSEAVTKAQAELSEAEAFRAKRFVELDVDIAANKTTPPEQDGVWQAIDVKIKEAEAEIGDPPSERYVAIDAARSAKVGEKAKLDKALAGADQAEKNKTRIKELEAQEKELAQKIASVDKQLADIEQFKTAQGRMLEDAVNDKFKYVEFKLFERQLNDSLDNRRCEATLNGTPYSGMSCGERIIVGVDIINVLSAHYDLSVPLFIDNAESLTLPLEATSQTIELYARRGQKEISVEVKEAGKAVA